MTGKKEESHEKTIRNRVGNWCVSRRFGCRREGASLDSARASTRNFPEIASLPAGYGPLYFASAVLPDGRVIVEGGEYNFCVPVWTNKGAIYDPIANSWSSVAPPPTDLEIALPPDK